MPKERATVLPFYALRLGDLVTPKADLEIYCGACRHSGIVDVVSLIHRRGALYGVRELEHHLRCKGCGMRGWAHIQVRWRGE